VTKGRNSLVAIATIVAILGAASLIALLLGSAYAWATTESITLPFSASGSLGSHLQQDTFLFHAEPGVMLHVKASATADRGEVHVELWGPSQYASSLVRLAEDSGGRIAPATLSYEAKKAGQYKVVVDTGLLASVPFEYVLSIWRSGTAEPSGPLSPPTTPPLPMTTTTTVVQRPGYPALPPNQWFSDVPPSHPYYVQISSLGHAGIVDGYFLGFRPDEYVTRQQFAKMMVLAGGYPVSTADVCPFRDVQKTSGDALYPDHYVAVCVAQGIAQGKTATQFGPYDNLTRAQLFTMVTRASNAPQPPSGYSPAFGNFSATHYPWARRASYAGLLDGLLDIDTGGYDFWASATRGEVCVLLYNAMGYMANGAGH
jgi:hypothetical protein